MTCSPNCSRCGEPRDRKGQRYCAACHRKYERERLKRNTRAIHLLKKFGLNLADVPLEQFDMLPRSRAGSD